MESQIIKSRSRWIATDNEFEGVGDSIQEDSNKVID